MKITLKSARVNVNMTQAEAAEKIGVSKDTVQKWERGKTVPNVKYIPRIEEAYNIHYDNIAFFTQK